MVYEEFAPVREHPHYKADWAGEFADLRHSGLQAVGFVLAVLGYTWALIQALAMHPAFAFAPISLPVVIGLLGLALLVVRRPTWLRSALYIGGTLAAGAVALWWQQSLGAPFVLVMVTVASTLVGPPGLVFGVAGASSLLLLAASHEVGAWPLDVVVTALAMYWGAAGVAWFTSRNLYTVLAWALRSYEDSWHTAVELQDERGRLNRTMRALSEANALLKRTTYDLAEAREEAERARQLKGQFAANISHELRTPLHLIVGFSQMMYTSPGSYEGVRWTPELRGDVQEIYESAQHLLRLIDDVLDLSQVEASRLPLAKEKVALAPLVRDSVETARSLLRDRGLYLRVEMPESIPSLYADPTRIRQVLLNLLTNAARFTESGGITVRVQVREEEVQVSVEDTGVGIPAEQLQDIFGEFHQVDTSLRRRYGGTGLGLAICREFVSLHDGRIWAESEVGKGSVFHFTLPLPSAAVVRRQRPQVASGWRYPASRPQAPRRLVTLAQPPQFQRLLTRYLDGSEVVAVDRPEELAGAVRQAQADAVVLPAGSLDQEALEELARECRPQLVPVVAFSLPLEEHLALAEGFSHCLMKPFSNEGLLRTLQEAAPDARRVLVVDDDPGVVRLVERYLSTAPRPVEILAAYDGEEALTLLDRAPDVLLLDLMLPKVNGLEVLQALRARPGGKQVPVVAITAYSFTRDVAALGQGEMVVRRGEHFNALEMTRWLETVLQAMPARHLTPGGPVSEPAPVPTG